LTNTCQIDPILTPENRFKPRLRRFISELILKRKWFSISYL
jgi:hypothetical protein